jgi:isoamylase
MSHVEHINIYPTHQHGNLSLRRGIPYPFGATFVLGGINFSIYSAHATSCTLVLYDQGEREPFAEIPFPEDFRIGHVFAMIVFDLNYENLEYGYRFDGPWDPEVGDRYDPSNILLDPYAKSIGGREDWGTPPDWSDPYRYRAHILLNDYDWGDDRSPGIPIEELVIYEMHVRGFTRHPSSGVKHPGTFDGLREKIPYLKELGVNAVELMPIFEFDEFEYSHRLNPLTGDLLFNYWGYSTVGFFAPKAGYAANGVIGRQSHELKNLVKALHASGIEVFLDVVFNHTSEGNANGPTISFRGIDNKTYYMLGPDGSYRNYSGTGNTLNCNHPVVREMVIDCLRYWVYEYHIDGFRFDLASILGRDQDGTPLASPPLIEALALDPILANTKLIAEAWDAGGLYQVGSFPNFGRWAEWNGRFRVALRRWLKGDSGVIGEVAHRIAGSPDLYATRGPRASINFITCHDGFTLNDLFSYNRKHNLANGESGRDGADDNYSWNCGVEGPTDAPAINVLRARMIRNAVTILMVSHGVPMILSGDEYGHTKYGNNNTYCHDNAVSWFNWDQLVASSDLHRFFKTIIAFRQAHPVLRSTEFIMFGEPEDEDEALEDEDREEPELEEAAGAEPEPEEAPLDLFEECPRLAWHGVSAGKPEWAGWNTTLAFTLCDSAADDLIYVAMNMHWQPLTFEIPAPPEGMSWHLSVDTTTPSPGDIYEPGSEPRLSDQTAIALGARAVVVLVAHR